VTWYPLYMSMLGDLRDEVNRELDRAQVGDPVPEDDPLLVAVGRCVMARQMEKVERD
jgi:hypothetical protein